MQNYASPAKAGSKFSILCLSFFFVVLQSFADERAIVEFSPFEVSGRNADEARYVRRIDGERLEYSNTLESIGDLNPSLEVTSSYGGNGAILNIRGPSSDSVFVVADPSVLTAIDDIPYASAFYGTLPIYDLERLEISAGPEGSSLGRNAMGGYINIRNMKPRLGAMGLKGYAKQTIGNYGHIASELVLDKPLSQWIGSRSSLYSESRNGFVENITEGASDLDDKSEFHARQQFYFKIDERQTALVSINYWSQDDSGVAMVPVGDRVAPSQLLDFSGETLQPNDPRKVALSDVQKHENTAYSVNGTYSYESSEWDYALTLSYQDSDLFSRFDVDFSDLDLMSFNDRENSRAFFTGIRAKWKSENREVNFGVTGYFDDRDQKVKVPANTLFGPSELLIAAEQKTDSYSPFLRGLYQLSPKISLVSGVRYTKDEKDSFQRFQPFLQPVPFEFTLVDDWSSTDYDFKFEYQASEEWAFYVKTATGYKSGGFMIAQGANPVAFDPERLTSYEAGAFFENGKTRVHALIFDYDYRDLQVSQFIGLEVRTTNAAKASVEGIEVTASHRLSDNALLSLDVAYNDASFDEYKNFVYELDPTGVPEDISGNRLVRVPRWRVSLNGKLDFPFSSERPPYSLSARFYLSDEAEFNVYNDPRFRQPQHHRLDLQAAYRQKKGPWQFVLYMNNVTDEVVPVGFDEGNLVLGLPNAFQYSAPRRYGASVKYVF